MYPVSVICIKFRLSLLREQSINGLNLIYDKIEIRKEYMTYGMMIPFKLGLQIFRWDSCQSTDDDF